eukprot:3102398-Karenia_brevis.AAC.1
MKPEETPSIWKFDGPRAAAETLSQIASGAGNLTSYHSEWVRLSGVSEGGAQAHEHRVICETLRMAVMLDRLDLTNLAWAEHLIRRLIALEIAVDRDPRRPDFSGLDLVEGGVTSSSGAVR